MNDESSAPWARPGEGPDEGMSAISRRSMFHQCCWIVATQTRLCQNGGVGLWNPRQQPGVGIPLCATHRKMAARVEINSPCMVPSHPNQVYFIRDKQTKLIKIGRSNNPRDRLKQVAKTVPDHVLELLAHTSETPEFNEAVLHHRFREDRVEGEWFRSSESLLELVAEISRYPLEIYTTY